MAFIPFHIASLLQKYAVSEYIDVDVTLGPGQILEYGYLVPKGFVWVKVDTRIDPDVPQRVFELSAWADDYKEIETLPISRELASESYRCIRLSIAKKNIWFKLKNISDTTHRFTALIRGFLIRTENYKLLIDVLTTVRLSDESMEKILGMLSETNKLLREIKELLSQTPGLRLRTE